MKRDRRIVAYVVYMILGIILFGLGFAEIVDEFWSGMGAALIVIGVVRMVQFYRFRKDENYREKYETQINDERNRFIRNKAWAWSGYIFIIVSAVMTIVFKVLEQDVLSMASSIAVCLLVILYWISYFILNKKY